MILCFNILSFIVYILILASNSFVRSSFFLLSIYIHPFPTPKTPNIPLKPLSPSPTLLNMLKTECALCRWITRESYSWGNNRRVPIYRFSRHCWYQPWRRIDRTLFVPSSCWKKCDSWALLLPSLLATCAPARCCGPCRASGRCPQQISCSKNPSISTIITLYLTQTNIYHSNSPASEETAIFTIDCEAVTDTSMLFWKIPVFEWAHQFDEL